jgi:hypothetical protein
MAWFDQFLEHLWRGWAYISSGRTLAIIFGVGFALLAIFLLIASRTKWGQAKPLTKAVVLSVLAHVWLLMYALGSRETLPQGSLRGREQSMSVAFDAQTFIPAADNVAEPESSDAADTSSAPAQPWERSVPLTDLPKPPELQRLFDSDLVVPDLLTVREPTPMPDLPPPEELTDERHSDVAAESGDSFDTQSQLVENIPDEQFVAPESSVLPPPLVDPLATSSSAPDADSLANLENARNQAVSNTYSPVLPPDRQLPRSPNLPQEYQLRQAPNRLQLAQAYGADADSEAAVEAGLRWLAAAQHDDGGWIAANHGGGTETRALGEYRHGTGDRADTGITGLALLAFLSAGHTHVEGEHQTSVKLGLQYLLRMQMPSGDLSGPKQVGNEPSVVNARMYCHSIATLALAEAYGMTHDAYLKDSLMRAAQYSINAQDIRGGGWRYRPRDPGDLSQFGWQAMALKSVERSGIEIPTEVHQRMRRFLESCSAGTYGGLARYRPGEGRPSETMTAESLACRLLLDYPMSLEARREATEMIMRNRPGQAEDNVYFWYYATLALFQLQDDNWRVWNQALKQRLLATQLPAYHEHAGSWEPDGIWGGYGGRVYSTAMSCLCLEVYYRYLPMYQHSNLARQPQSPSLSR